MARRPRLCPEGIPQHIIQRGNNRQSCFACDKDFAAYSNWLHEGATKYGVSIHAWAFMNNHVHLLATPSKPHTISSMMQYVGRYYVRYFNHKYDRSGTLWEGRFKSCLVQEDRYFFTCQRYIELNPVRANMVASPSQYSWSSYRANALGIDTKLLTPHVLYLQLGKSNPERQTNYLSLFDTEIDQTLIEDIRNTTQRGLVLGSEKFKLEIEAITGQRATAMKPGPKPTKQKQTKTEQEFLL